jgi:APA family basic amino acid/polyamine antiporter
VEIFKKKSLDKLCPEEKSECGVLNRVLSKWDLTAIGIGCIIGTGIFVLTGVAAIKYAGPGVMISFIICAFACALAALCYAEFASRIPLAGSAYTYGYATMGEIFAWIIGWDLILEYAVSASTVAIGWSGYFVNLLESWFGLKLPVYLTSIRTATNPGGFINLPAVIISLAITALLVWGIRESANINALLVVVKVGIALFFIGVGIFFIKTVNWHPLIPPFVPHAEEIANPMEVPLLKYIFKMFGTVYPDGFGGWPGIMTAAAIVFFAYIGFDAISTTAEEARNPQTDLPFGIISSLLICTVLYIGMSAVFTGIVRCDGTLKLSDLGADQVAPMAYAFKQTGVGWVSTFASGLISVGAILGITSVLLVSLLGQTRLFFAMSRDKLLPAFVSTVHPRFKTPYIITIVTGILVAAAAAVTPIEVIAELTSIGTLFAFVIVCGGVLLLPRVNDTEGRKYFRTPGMPVVPILGILINLLLMASLPLLTWYQFAGWMLLGLTIYACYSYFNSDLREQQPARSLHVMVASIVGLVYALFSQHLVRVYHTLMGKIPAIAFVFGLSLFLLAGMGLYGGIPLLKSQDETGRKQARVAVAIGIAGLAAWGYFLWSVAGGR